VTAGAGVSPGPLDASPGPPTDVPRLLFMGGAQRNKNLVTAIEAVALANRSRRFDFLVTPTAGKSMGCLLTGC